MCPLPVQDAWSAAQAYEAFMGRWSRLLAIEFLDWLKLRTGLGWCDLGCGTGALSAAILGQAEPRSILACDLSEPFLQQARRTLADRRVSFVAAQGGALPLAPGALQVVVSGLAINFFPAPGLILNEIRRAMTPSGTVAAYVWDYSQGMELLRHFWDTAVELDASANTLHEGRRFPLCLPGPLKTLFEAAGLRQVVVEALEITTLFEGFEDYWEPFLGATGPAPSYVATLSNQQRVRLETELRARLFPSTGTAVELPARAWAVRGTV